MWIQTPYTLKNPMAGDLGVTQKGERLTWLQDLCLLGFPTMSRNEYRYMVRPSNACESGKINVAAEHMLS